MTDHPTRDTMPPVSAGKVRIANAGTYDRSLNAETAAIAQAIGALHGFPIVRFYHTTRGYVCAGSAMRWDEAQWHVNWQEPDGSIHGRRFLEAHETEARAHFDKLTDTQSVSAMRQHEAMMEDTVYGPARAERVKRAADEKARKAAIAAYRRAAAAHDRQKTMKTYYAIEKAAARLDALRIQT